MGRRLFVATYSTVPTRHSHNPVTPVIQFHGLLSPAGKLRYMLCPRPIQTRVATALLAPFLTFQLCPQPPEWPRPMLRKVPIGRQSDWGININNAGLGKGLRPEWHTAGRCWPRASRAQLHDQHLLGAAPKVP